MKKVRMPPGWEVEGEAFEPDVRLNFNNDAVSLWFYFTHKEADALAGAITRQIKFNNELRSAKSATQRMSVFKRYRP